MPLLKSSSLPDIKNICKCHQQSFPYSFSNKLGEKYIAKSLEWFLVAPNRFLFHIENNEQIIGYCGGFISQYSGDGSTSGMMQYAMKVAAIEVLKRPWLFFNKKIIRFYPLIIKNIVRKVSPKKKLVNLQVSTISKKKLGLVVIAVHPDYRGKKIFEMMMKQFEVEAVQRNIDTIILSVKKENIRAINAYKKAGWTVEKESINSLEMTKNLL